MKKVILILSLFLVLGCGQERAQQLVTPMTDTAMPEIPKTPVKLIWLIDDPESGTDAYLQWAAAIAPTLQAPAEVLRIRAYDNANAGLRPHRLIALDFASFLDAATYLNRPEIAAILEDLPNRLSHVTQHTFIQRSDRKKTEADNWRIKSVLLIDYPLGGKQAYLEWVDAISSTIMAPEQLQGIASYDNYYGESPHRLITADFASKADRDAYEALAEIMALEPEFDKHTGHRENHTFKLRSDYINTQADGAPGN